MFSISGGGKTQFSPFSFIVVVAKPPGSLFGVGAHDVTPPHDADLAVGIYSLARQRNGMPALPRCALEIGRTG